MNFVNKDHFILVGLQAKSQTSIDVIDRDLLDRTGFRPVDRHEIVKEKSVEELNAQLVSLVGENGGRNAHKRLQKQEKHFGATVVLV